MAIAAIRNNNPGNVSLPIKGWQGGGTIVGIQGQPGYAQFPSMEVGYAAFSHRVNDYIDNKGLTTLRQLNTRYAEDKNWSASISRATGIGIDTPLNTGDVNQMALLRSGIIRQETGMSPSKLGIDPAWDANGGTIPPIAGDKLGKSSSVSAEGSKLPWAPKTVGATDINPDSPNIVKATDMQTIQQASSATEQAKAIIAAASQTAATEAATSQAVLQSTGGWLAQTQTWAGDWLGRGFIILLGLLFVGGALGLLIWKGPDALPELVKQ